MPKYFSNNAGKLTEADTFVYVGNWVNKPSSLTNNYTDRIFITDVGMGGSEWYWDGERYRVVGGQVVLKAMKTTDAVISQTWAETTGSKNMGLGYSIPAGVLGLGDTVIVDSTLVVTSGAGTALNTVYSQTKAGVFAIGSCGPVTMAGTDAFSGNNSARCTLSMGFMIKSNTVITGTRWGNGGSVGNNNSSAPRNSTVANITTTPLAIEISVVASSASTGTAVVELENYAITLLTCG